MKTNYKISSIIMKYIKRILIILFWLIFWFFWWISLGLLMLTGYCIILNLNTFGTCDHGRYLTVWPINADTVILILGLIIFSFVLIYFYFKCKQKRSK